MKNKIIITASALLIALSTFSQNNAMTPPAGYKYNSNFDVALGVGRDQFSGAISWVRFYGIGKNKKFKIGYGLRFTSYFGSNQNYITAPSKIISGQTGSKGWFPKLKNFPENLDTLFISKAQVNALNASINLQYSFSPKFDVGFNIDAVGFSFGAKQSGKFISSIRLVGMSETQTASVTSFNLLLVSNNDIGTLNSEFYAIYWFSNKLGVKGGFIVLFTEYTTDNKLTFDNNRFRNKSERMGMIGITYTPFK